MIIFHNFGDAGLSACTPRLKQMPIPLGLAIAGIASSVLGTGANVLMQKRANEQSIANQNSLYHKQKQYQNFLNANGMLIQKQAMQRAGFNPNAQFGTSANLQSPTPSKSDIVAPQLDTAGINAMLQQYMQLGQQKPVIDANARKINADAENQEIQNDILRGESDEAGGAKQIGVLNWNMKNSEFQYKLTQWNADNAEAQLRISIANDRLKPEYKNIYDALLKMPYREYRYLFQQTRNLIADTELKGSQKKLVDAQEASERLDYDIKHDSSIMELIDKYIGDGMAGDFARAMVLLFGAFSGNVNLGRKAKITKK